MIVSPSFFSCWCLFLFYLKTIVREIFLSNPPATTAVPITGKPQLPFQLLLSPTYPFLISIFIPKSPHSTVFLATAPLHTRDTHDCRFSCAEDECALARSGSKLGWIGVRGAYIGLGYKWLCWRPNIISTDGEERVAEGEGMQGGDHPGHGEDDPA